MCLLLKTDFTQFKPNLFDRNTQTLKNTDSLILSENEKTGDFSANYPFGRSYGFPLPLFHSLIQEESQLLFYH